MVFWTCGAYVAPGLRDPQSTRHRAGRPPTPHPAHPSRLRPTAPARKVGRRRNGARQAVRGTGGPGRARASGCTDLAVPFPRLHSGPQIPNLMQPLLRLGQPSPPSPPEGPEATHPAAREPRPAAPHMSDGQRLQDIYSIIQKKFDKGTVSFQR